MRSAYIAGKMRGLPQDNFPMFHRAARDLRFIGWSIISPAEMDMEAGEHSPTGITTGQIVDYSVNRRIVRRDLDAIQTLRAENHDAIIVLPGWETSVGTNAELRVGKWLGLELLQLTWGPDGVILKQLEI